MTQEDKNLLLKDLCARLPYGVICDCLHGYHTKASAVDAEDLTVVYYPYCDEWEPIEDCKPYLRPMSNMTEEEWEELNCIGYIVPLYDGSFGVDMRAYCRNSQPHYRRFSEFSAIEDWLNAHHLDYRGLIEKGLALEAPEGMYK